MAQALFEAFNSLVKVVQVALPVLNPLEPSWKLTGDPVNSWDLWASFTPAQQRRTTMRAVTRPSGTSVLQVSHRPSWLTGHHSRGLRLLVAAGTTTQWAGL